MQTFKTKAFARLADREGLEDAALCEAVRRALRPHGPRERSSRWNAMTKQYRSEALATAHEAALCLAEAGVMSKRTMCKFDEMCLTPVEEMTPEAIRELRLRERAS